MDRNRLITDRRTLLVGAGLFGLAGCASTGGSMPMPEVRGLERLPMTQGVLNRYVTERRLPGVAVGVRAPDGSDIFIQAGTLDFNVYNRVSADSLFRIYSMTKPVTGTAAALLIEDGRLTLDQPVADFIPEFASLKVLPGGEGRLTDARPAQNIMTIRHLLTHTSGLTYNIVGDGPVQRAYRRNGILPFTGDLGAGEGDGPKVRDLDEMAARLADIPLIAEPGTAYNYSVSLDALGLVIQRASGMSFPDFVQRRILNPVGMDDTVWRLRPGDADRLMQIYAFGRNSDNPPVVPPGASAEAYSAPVTLYAGGAGLVSSTRDYLDFLSMLLNDGRSGRVRVMRPETARLIRSDILPEGLTALNGGYGFGGWVARPGHRRQGEYGWSGAAGTQGWIDPERNFAATMMIQAMPYGAVDIISEVRPAIDADLGIVRS
ncbi:MAG: serine hydrolase domain-containing protein [Brevundimonas sp.]|uniref:serine hydrolase domain-containing protein n=1 Tax=Brevundimonas sp. TaxID=1871086 RepID=UPI0040333C88